MAFLSVLNESLIISRHRWRTLVPFDLTVGSNAAHLPRFGDGQSWSQCNFKAPRGGGWDTLVICSSRVLMSINRKMTADPPKFLLKGLEQYSNFCKEEVFKRVLEHSWIGTLLAGKSAYGFFFGSYSQALVYCRYHAARSRFLRVICRVSKLLETKTKKNLVPRDGQVFQFMFLF